ncbi:hypothetical protein P4S73_29420 [Paraglaciecola sp. Hal342]|jgi:hypothetical protein|uniref:Uncharacterized protein n=1 Tax=Paraglaciecola chathamensis TaxID=368405 RepID=A0A8H9LY65_9ALTE|nr:hypothetical protein [Paraglaciecola oceanifecundans]GGZ77857.1 hypothetical protein GCM10011274_40040 [Paraglaciecola oceanifecundans]
MQQLNSNQHTAPRTLNGYIEAQAEQVTLNMQFETAQERTHWIEQHHKEIVDAAFKRFSADASARLRTVLSSSNCSLRM